MNERELLSLKKEIETAKSKASELTGRLNYLMQQLKSDWDFVDVDQAKGMLDSIHKEISSLDNQIEQTLKEIEEKYHVGQNYSSKKVS